MWAGLNFAGWLLIALCAPQTFGFSNTRLTTTILSTNSRSRIFMVDPSLLDPNLIDVTIAVVSAAAGAASQLPKIQELEKEVKDAREALSASELDMVEKIKELEDKLFLMDEEFERQTEKVRKQYDKRMWDEVARVTEKVKVDYQYKLEIKVEEVKARLLQEQLTLVNRGTKRGELAELRLKQTQIEENNAVLERALKDSQVELDKIQSLARSKKGWWPF